MATKKALVELGRKVLTDQLDQELAAYFNNPTQARINYPILPKPPRKPGKPRKKVVRSVKNRVRHLFGEPLIRPKGARAEYNQQKRKDKYDFAQERNERAYLNCSRNAVTKCKTKRDKANDYAKAIYEGTRPKRVMSQA